MFSVVIPAYNCEMTICDVLLSVLNQTRFDLIEEIIIINDGSTDNTDDIIHNFIMQHLETEIRYYTQKNRGVSYTRNKGILLARAKWIALLDSDDLWKKNKIERQYECIIKHKDIYFLGSMYPLKFLFGKKRGLYKVSARKLCIRSCPSTPSIVFEKQKGIELGLFDEDRSFCEDIQFFQKFLLFDSYYILAEDLITISYAKKHFASSGLSSNLYEMHVGRNENVRELERMHLISKCYMNIMLFFNEIKFLRRKVIQYIRKGLND